MKGARNSGLKAPASGRRTSPERAEVLTQSLEHCRRLIQQELDAVSRRLREEYQPETGDAGDCAVCGFERELRSARADRLTSMLRQVSDAVSRHEEGRYGRCLACDADIPVERLRSLPFALYCRDCQAALEESREGLVGSIA